MIATQQRQLWFVQRTQTQVKPVQSITPVLAGALMLVAGGLPWLVDPLGTSYSAWALAIDIGWQFHTTILSYGLLCTCIALYAFLVAYAQWRPFVGSAVLVQKRTQVGLLCLLPTVLFLMQYLYMDVAGINTLGNHLLQSLLLKQHLGYSVSPIRVAVKPFLLDTSTLAGRFQILINLASLGVLVPCISAWLLIDRKRFFLVLPRGKTAKPKAPLLAMPHRKLLFALGVALLLILVGRPAVALGCDYEAKTQLAAGNYVQALHWLDAAHFFNPSLDQVASYHIERGQALYFSTRSQEDDDTRSYLASVYSEELDYLDAYSQLIAVWQAHKTLPWVIDETSITLERLSEQTKPLFGLRVQRMQNNENALAWIQQLRQVDATNIYAHYMNARIQYEQHNYGNAISAMVVVLQLSNNADIQSSAYTYIALSDERLGDYIQARADLFKAIVLDPNFSNNTAREELSGLR